MIKTKKLDRVVTLEIDCPPLNVLDTTTLDALTAALQSAAMDDDLAAVLIRGAGKCFSAGASVEEHQPEKAKAMVQALNETCTALQDLPVPVVALVHGACLGGGLELALFCDMIIADPTAQFGQPEIKLAFFPPLAAYRLPRLIGYQNAAWCVFTGGTLDAERSLQMGLIQELLPQEKWEKIEQRFNRLSAPVLRLAKKSLSQGLTIGRELDLQAQESLFLKDLYQVEDVQEGISSFAEKRRPQWNHR